MKPIIQKLNRTMKRWYPYFGNIMEILYLVSYKTILISSFIFIMQFNPVEIEFSDIFTKRYHVCPLNPIFLK